MIRIKLSKKQTRAWNLLFDKTTLFIGYGGGAFSGKSYLMCYWLTYMSLNFERTAWGLGRKELITLKKTTLVTLFKVFNEIGLSNELHYNYNQQLNKITFFNGSVIYLIDTAYKPSDPLYERFGGLELTGAAIDESSETDVKAIEILFTRLGRCLNNKYGITKKLLESFNPAKTHVYSRYYKPWKDKSEPIFRKFIQALPSDNPSPEVPDYIEGILLTGEQATIQRLIYGNFEYDDNPFAMFDYDSICNLFTNSFIKGNGIKYMSCDIAYMGADVFVITIWDGFIVEKVLAIDKIDETAIGSKLIEVAEQYSVPYSNIVYDSDGLRKFTANSLKKLTAAKPFVNNAAPIKSKNYKNLKAECIFYLKEKVESNEVFIKDNEFRKQIIFDLDNICRNQTDDEGKISIESKKLFKERTGKSFDFLDSLLMRMFFEIKITGGWE
jgi:phage terminase large subunit